MSKSKRTTVSGTFTLFYIKTPLTITCLLRATASDVLSFVDFKFYFYHSYY
jgi:di/tricarboxylate transporter